MGEGVIASGNYVMDSSAIHISMYVCTQSGDVQSSTMLALTIIPVHDDNIDLEYEPVS